MMDAIDMLIETGNKFSRELLEKELHRLHPAVVRYDENEEEI